MGKRSDFERRPRDFYPTPEAAVLPLLPHLYGSVRFDEPCVGDGALIRHLEKHGHTCIASGDVATGNNALDITATPAEMFITNPPWSRDILHPLIQHLSRIAPTWLLFDADWMHTRQSADLMRYCHRIVSVGRVKWIPGTTMTGKDNCAWYQFLSYEGMTVFCGR